MSNSELHSIVEVLKLSKKKSGKLPNQFLKYIRKQNQMDLMSRSYAKSLPLVKSLRHSEPKNKPSWIHISTRSVCSPIRLSVRLRFVRLVMRRLISRTF